MDPEIAKYMRTERKPGSIDKIHYMERKSLRKTVELPMINSRTDCHALAKEVVNQCDLIHHSRLAEVEQIIYYLKKRKLHGAVKGPSKIDVVKGSFIPILITGDIDKNGDKAGYAEANYNNLSEYIDLLYEGMPEKTRGAHLIQLLARDPENLEALSKNETLISALGRVLREDWKRSITLSTHLVFTFFCFSMYSQFHEIILKCKVGSICMDIIDFELRRYDKWKADLEGSAAPADTPIVKKSCPNSANANIKAAMDGSIYDDLTTSMENLDDKRLSPEQKMKRFRTLVRKQEHLLRVAYYLLLNIAEDESVEEKMSKRNIVGLLIKALDRDNDDLLILVTTFLKKLSIMQCNKDVMATYNIIDKLPKMLDSKSADLVHLTLKLFFNLSFDNKFRSVMVKAGLIPKIVTLMGDDRHQEVVLKLLYHLSYDEDSKIYFIDCIGFIVDMLLLGGNNEGDKIMIALCINLAAHTEISQQMVRSMRLQSLITRAFFSEDSMLMKLLHNISNNPSLSASFIEFVGDISKAIVKSNDMDFVRECIGILSNLHLPELDWAEIFKHFGMSVWIKNIITINNTDPELVLQVIILLGTAASDEKCAKLLCDDDIITKLIDLLKTHQEDDEIVLQIIYTFYVTLWYKDNIQYLIEKTDVPAYLIDLLQDNNKNIRKICNMCLNIISEYDNSWADRIRIEKFRHHNAQWLQMVDSQQLEPEEEEEDELPPYLNTEYLSQAVVKSSNVDKILHPDDDKDIGYMFQDDFDIEALEDYELEDL
ncbi:hypothetical protein GWI33_022631 [Rhynchophorus ferrugineus]|uniref:Kinesin-associated protein 3 n=1 Tax=Rhynchophorus ferrugineus TaxID=354439 RepID=A0A834MMF5_RHYFE|nr:hypothetical protein GWI33_022631 [Rhynchophorus ferrugineus]